MSDLTSIPFLIKIPGVGPLIPVVHYCIQAFIPHLSYICHPSPWYSLTFSQLNLLPLPHFPAWTTCSNQMIFSCCSLNPPHFKSPFHSFSHCPSSQYISPFSSLRYLLWGLAPNPAFLVRHDISRCRILGCHTVHRLVKISSKYFCVCVFFFCLFGGGGGCCFVET